MNKMREVAELLGVQLDEEFEIVDKERKYRITKNGLEVLFESTWWFPADSQYLVSIIKGTFEIKKPILDKLEKQYLENVIRPFKDRVNYIVKCKNEIDDNTEYIMMYINQDDSNVFFPSFKSDSMYKGMKIGKHYYLKELGLFED